MKKYLTCLLIGTIIISSALISCKSEIEKIDINNVEAHRAYQNRVLNSDSTNQGFFANIKKLIKEYRELEKDHFGNENLNYYFARIYNNVSVLPFRGFWLDTISNKIVNETDYINFYDSTFYYAEKGLEKNKDNIRAMSILCTSFFWEKYRYDYFPKCKVPFSRYRNETGFHKRALYIINNALRFKDIDTTNGKSLSRSISEIALYLLALDIDHYKNIFDPNNAELVSKYFLLGEHLDYVKGQESVDIDLDKTSLQKKYLTNIILARNELQRQKNVALEAQRQKAEKEAQLNKLRDIDLKHKYWLVNVEANTSSMISLSGWDIFSQVTGDLYGNVFTTGNGEWKRSYLDQIVFTNKSRITLSGSVDVSINSNGKILLTLPNGVVYIQDDDGYYYKNRISTPKKDADNSSSNRKNNNDELLSKIGSSFGYIWERVDIDNQIYTTTAFDDNQFRTTLFKMNGSTNSEDFTVFMSINGSWEKVDDFNIKGVIKNNNVAVSWKINEDFEKLTNNKGIIFTRVKVK